MQCLLILVMKALLLVDRFIDLRTKYDLNKTVAYNISTVVYVCMDMFEEDNVIQGLYTESPDLLSISLHPHQKDVMAHCHHLLCEVMLRHDTSGEASIERRIR